MDADREFFVGGLRCYAQNDMLIKVGAKQLPKRQQFTVRMRVEVEDREDAVRRYVREKNHVQAAALIGEHKP